MSVKKKYFKKRFGVSSNAGTGLAIYYLILSDGRIREASAKAITKATGYTNSF